MSKLTLVFLAPLTLCMGCLAALIPSASPRIETTELEKVAQEVDTYFADNKKVYASANETIAALSDAQGNYGLSASDYQALTASILSSDAFVVPNHLSPEQKSSLLDVVKRAKDLQLAVTQSATKMAESATFLSSKTAVIESELVSLRSNYELIKRNPLASRRDKGRAANQIRKANKLGKSFKARALEQHQELMTLQKSSLTTLKDWSFNLKDIGGSESRKALSGIEQKKNSVVGTQIQNIEDKALNAADETLQKANVGMEAGAQLIQDTEAKLDNQKASLTEQTRSKVKALEGKVDGQVQAVEAKVDGQVKTLKQKANSASKAAQKTTKKQLEQAKTSLQDTVDDSIESATESADEDN